MVMTRDYRGSKIVQVRIPDETLAELEAILARSVLHSQGEPYTMSSWIKKAIAEKLAHCKRHGKRSVAMVASASKIPSLTKEVRNGKAH